MGGFRLKIIFWMVLFLKTRKIALICCFESFQIHSKKEPMFKAATLFRLTSALPDLTSLQASLQQKGFEPCGPTQELAWGWTSPRGEAHGALVEAVGGHWILSLQVQVKKVPGHALQERVEAKMAQHLEGTGNKAGKRQKAEFTDEARLDLLPHAFAKTSTLLAWIDTANAMLVINSASASQCAVLIDALLKTCDGIALQPIDTATSPTAAMAHWLTTLEWPAELTGESECELRATDDTKAKVRYDNHQLEIDEIKQHIAGGKLPTKLGLNWNDKVALVLTEKLTLKKIALLDVNTDTSATRGGSVDAFDANVALSTQTLSPAIAALISALGGLLLKMPPPPLSTTSSEATEDATVEAEDTQSAALEAVA